MRILAPTLAAAFAALSTPALAGPTLSLNGVVIDGVTDQKFENATVLIDAVGNVYITVKGYLVKGDPAPPPATVRPPPATATPLPGPPPPAAAPAPQPPIQAAPVPLPGVPGAAPAVPGAVAPPKLQRRYFLATQQSQADGTQYDVEVFINASWIRVIRSGEPQVVQEVTRFMRPGQNRVTLVASKKLNGSPRRYYSSDVTLKVVVGEGNVGGDHVMIDDPLVIMTRTAAETEDKTEEYTVEAR